MQFGVVGFPIGKLFTKARRECLIMAGTGEKFVDEFGEVTGGGAFEGDGVDEAVERVALVGSAVAVSSRV